MSVTSSARYFAQRKSDIMGVSGIDIDMKMDDVSMQKLKRNLKVLPEVIYNRKVGVAARHAMKQVAKTAKQLAPKNTGLLAESIGIKTKKYKRSGTAVVVVGPRSGFKDPKSGANPMNYAHLVELGTGGHRIPTKAVGKGQIVRQPWEHPGTPPRPFLLPALERNADRVISEYGQKILKDINKEVEKLGRS